ncbi:C4-dicarboxylate ABC transporter substrate-binding protein [Photobacterium profundum]|uniref:Putative immunogenic protein n=1 Tax=Photobacterium profundum 3TCK TaxID=314280 RepID=Q1YVX0_9GAMM|nr:TAXI family TRAP transporter solute-binding subunit [Photobacterium profundum]EAS40419.1 putative immunogenic protein [Photobacterium profundum 3TCK]PSV63965.1 C4-dicarboxylate ABC transporter substrate-binding protein [Photobacterium profundum]
MKRISLSSVLVGLISLVVSLTAHAEQFITIGTGGVTGVYYPTGGAICRLVNKDRKTHGIRCSVESTGGSIYNINTIRAGELDLAIAQSDWQHHAYNGTSLFEEKGPFKSLRSVFSLHAEPFTVVARADSGIKTFDDLKGKRVNIGNPGSGQRGTMEVLMKAKGWTMKDFKLVSELKASEQSKALCDNKIDAMIYTVGHPSGAIKEATTSCSSVIVEVAGPVIDKLVDENAFYRIVTIPGGMYMGSENGVKTFGVGATFVSSTQVDNNVIYAVTQSVFDNFNEFKRLHPAFSGLKKEEMINDGLTAPLHDGAKKYFIEVGLLAE